MNLNMYRNLFIVVTLVLTLVAAFPVIAIVAPFQVGSERFSELWLLGPDHIAENYPFNVSAGEMYNVFVGVSNHMGSSEYYKVLVKFRSGSLPLSTINSYAASSLSPIYEYQFFVNDEEVWESSMTFGFQDVSVKSDSVSVGNITLDGMVFPVHVTTHWDSEYNGFYFQLLFELWRYDEVSKIFRFHDRFVGIWLNMTSSS